MKFGWRALQKQWFLLSLVAVLIAGLTWPDRLSRATDISWLRNAVVGCVMFLMALPLETRVIRETLRRPWAAILGSLINMVLLPLLAWYGSALLAGDLSVGLIVASAVPCTLASAAVWTRRAGGNDAAAILVTVLTNGTCFLTTPFWLARLTRVQAAMNISKMILDLGLLVVLPMTLGQLVRCSPSVAAWATQRKRACGTLAQCGILWMVLTGAVECGHRLHQVGENGSIPALSLANLSWLVTVTASLHLAALGCGYWAARATRLNQPDCIAVAIAGSQKTLMVGLHIAIQYFSGLAILPMISYHVGQLFLDTLIADRWAASSSTSFKS